MPYNNCVIVFDVEEEINALPSASSLARTKKRWQRPPRFSCPISFLSRIPFQIALLTTVISLSLLQCDTVLGTYTQGCFDQLVDHSDAQNQQLFCQRYWQQTKWWTPKPILGEPMVLLMITSFAYPQGDLENSALTYWAQDIGAMIIEIETRYTGQSFPNRTTAALRYASVDQHVQDLVRFIANISESLDPIKPRWILIGSFFDGAYSTWFRSKYPSLGFGSISFSPYLVAAPEHTDYDVVYQQYIGSTCASAISSTVKELSNKFQQWTLAEKSSYEIQCGCTADFGEDAEFFYVIAQLVIGSLYDPSVVCNNVTAAANKVNGLDNFANLLKYLLDQSYLTCDQWNIAKDTGGNSFRAILYLQCTQLGQFQTAPSGLSLVAPDVNLAWYRNVCRNIFNDLITAEPDTLTFNAAYGGGNPAGCNMAFVTSINDPYRAIGPDINALIAASDSNHVINVTCADPVVNLNVLTAPDSSERSCITDARTDMLVILRKWQLDTEACRVPTQVIITNNNDDDGDDVAAIVGPLSALAGIVLGAIIGAVITFFIVRAFYRHMKRNAWKLN